MTTPSETIKEKLIEALLSDQVTPSASSRLLKNSIFPNQNYYRYDTILHTF